MIRYPVRKPGIKNPLGQKKTGNVLLDRMQCFEFRGLELQTNLGSNNKSGLVTDKTTAVKKNEIAKNASTLIFTQIFIAYNQM